jgi:hypothetical protein
MGATCAARNCEASPSLSHDEPVAVTRSSSVSAGVVICCTLMRMITCPSVVLLPALSECSCVCVHTGICVLVQQTHVEEPELHDS